MSKYRSDFNVRVNVRKYAGKDPSYYASKHGRMDVSINVYSSMQRKNMSGYVLIIGHVREIVSQRSREIHWGGIGSP
jgi:hypothetical protein